MIRFENNRLWIDEKDLDLPYRIQKALDYGDRIVVLYRWGDATFPPGRYTMFHNLIAMNRAGEPLWTAELPEKKYAQIYSRSADFYSNIESGPSLVAYSWSSYRCEIDLETGKIVKLAFTK